MALLRRGHEGDRDEARRLLHLALGEAQRLQLPEAQQIEQLIERAALGALPSEKANDEIPDDGSSATEAVPPAPPPPPPGLEPVTRGISGLPGDPTHAAPTSRSADKPSTSSGTTNRRPNHPGDPGEVGIRRRAILSASRHAASSYRNLTRSARSARRVKRLLTLTDDLLRARHR